MSNRPATTSPDALRDLHLSSREQTLRVILLRGLGALLCLYGIGWAALLYIYLGFLRETLPTLSDLSRASVARFLHLPQIHFIQVVAFASPLPLLVFGIGCLCAAEWARRASIAFLTLQFLSLLLIIFLLVQGVQAANIQFQITTRHGYFMAATFVFSYGLLIELFSRARAANPASPAYS